MFVFTGHVFAKFIQFHRSPVFLDISNTRQNTNFHIKRSKMPKWTVRLALTNKSMLNKKQQFECADSFYIIRQCLTEILSRNEVLRGWFSWNTLSSVEIPFWFCRLLCFRQIEVCLLIVKQKRFKTTYHWFK